MIERVISGVGGAILMCVLLTSAAWAQQASGIAGTVRDASGAVLPGVTVEASSPALIEKVRTAVTDDEGRYNVVALPPGTYTVTFTLAGFSVVRRDGIVLTAGFAAAVNADLAIGTVEETITVTGASPLVDTQNVRTQTVVSTELLEVLPSSTKSTSMFTKLTPGFSTEAERTNVGGSAGPFWANSSAGQRFRGRAGLINFLDSMRINDLNGASLAYITNSGATEEMTVETSGFSAESPASGVAMNVIPKAGGNIFTGTVSSLWSSESMYSDNLGEQVRARGVTEGEEIKQVFNLVVAAGGPVAQDRLWFFTAPKWDRTRSIVGDSFFNGTQGTPFFTPSTRRGFKRETWRSTPLRLTWQASQKDKVSGYADYEPYCACMRAPNRAAETSTLRIGSIRIFQGSWTRPATNRLLLEAGAMFMQHDQFVPPEHPIFGPEVGPSDISITDALTGTIYNAGNALGLSAYGRKLSRRYFQRYSVTYVTGSHNVKGGIHLDQGSRREENIIKNAITYTFRGSSPGAAVPLSLTQYTTPYTTLAKLKYDLGAFVQDQWKMQRWTLNLGLRFDHLNMYVPAQLVAATRFVDAREFAEVPNVPHWKDLNPRVGAAYDLFGNGRTALKASLSRYVVLQGASFTNTFDPLNTSVNSVTRDWNDANANYLPDCDLRNRAANGECGVMQNLNFGGTRPTTQWADNLIAGFGVREGYWTAAAEVQHQLTDEVSLAAGYYSTWNFNPRVTDNLLVGPEDYSPFFITAPVDPRLPGGGGNVVSGLYDLNPAKVGQVNSLVRPASDFGRNRTETSDFVSFSVNTRFRSNLRLGGSVDSGRTVVDNCFVVDSPQLLDCRVVTSWKDQLQLKLFGSYPFPGGLAVSAILNNIPGVPILASYTVTRAQIQGLGRPLSTSNRIVPLITPGTRFEPRATQLDVQLSKTIELRRYRLKPNLGVYNVLNASSTAVFNPTYGPDWRPLNILPGRLAQISAELSF